MPGRQRPSSVLKEAAYSTKKQSLSVTSISNILNIPRSTVSPWLSNKENFQLENILKNLMKTEN
jgi:predicted transcriptional regulator